ncbi:hypothetical protein E2P81_ATG00963 [Venturia nashicola]|nr:hypothetical protein E2P81_ATG00963 [Venturia nashicola]
MTPASELPHGVTKARPRTPNDTRGSSNAVTVRQHGCQKSGSVLLGACPILLLTAMPRLIAHLDTASICKCARRAESLNVRPPQSGGHNVWILVMETWNEETWDEETWNEETWNEDTLERLGI